VLSRLFLFSLGAILFSAPLRSNPLAEISGLETLRYLNSQNSFTKDLLEKKKKILFFVASYCHYCEKEVPFLEEQQSQYLKLGYSTYFIFVDKKKDLALEAIKNWNIKIKSVWDEEGILREHYRVKRTPHLVILNSDNIILESLSGSLATRKTLMQIK
jgi:thiol-disulfide isomerase/thioredoxin